MTSSPKRHHRHGIAATLASAAVLCVAAGFSVYASAIGSRAVGPSYRLRATFVSSNGLHPGADVILAGVAVGSVTSVVLNPQTLMSDVTFRIDRSLSLPTDTRLAIGSSTLTSGDALMVLPGHAHQILQAGAALSDTCDSTSLEQQVSQYIFGSGGASSSCGD